MRIRYKNISESIKQSVQTLKHSSNGAQYKVLLNLAEHQWMVLDANTDLVAASGHNMKLPAMLKEARQALLELGVGAEKETRKRVPRVQG